MPPCTKYSIPVTIKRNLPPDYELSDEINALLVVDLVPANSEEVESLGVKAFWSRYANTALRREVAVTVYKAGKVPKLKNIDFVTEEINNGSNLINDSASTLIPTPRTVEDMKSARRDVSFSIDIEIDSNANCAKRFIETPKNDRDTAKGLIPQLSVIPKKLFFLGRLCCLRIELLM